MLRNQRLIKKQLLTLRAHGPTRKICNVIKQLQSCVIIDLMVGSLEWLGTLMKDALVSPI